MNKKSIVDFSAKMDDYLNGISNKVESEEYNELFEVGKTLAGKDFSKNSNKEALYHELQKTMSVNKGDVIMIKSKKIRVIAVVAAVFAFTFIISVSLMQTTFAQNLLDKIINSISLGHITVIQSEPSQKETNTIQADTSQKETNSVQAEQEDKISDKNKVKLEENQKTPDIAIYHNGEKVEGNLKDFIITQQKNRKTQNDQILEIKSSIELNNYTSFKVILPSYLPEGYKFNRGELFKDEKGNVSNKYISLFFTNEKTGKEIYMQQRIADNETAYIHETDVEIEKIKINGIDAVISDGRTIEWENNNVLYMLSVRDIDKSGLIKIAESIK